jgi:AraC family transcriptional regulator
MKLRRWIVGAGEVASFRDEADYREYAQGDAVVLLSEGRPALTWNCWVPGSVWMPVRGSARLYGRDLRLTLATDQLLLAEHGNRLTVQAGAGQDASLVGVLLPPDRVRACARREFDLGHEDPTLFPAVLRSEPAFANRLLAVAQAALRGEDPFLAARSIDELIVQLLRAQASHDAAIERCPGRSPRYRRQLYLRLMRVRNHIDTGASLGAEGALARLADIAKLSPTHFLRVYRDVFGRTPHKHVVAARMEAARAMLLSTHLGVTQVCRALGFENRCAFARSFKQHYGIAPTHLRASVRAADASGTSAGANAGIRNPRIPAAQIPQPA